MNIFKKCSICGENFKLTRQDGELQLGRHLETTHSEEHREQLRKQTEYYNKLNELTKLYRKRNAWAWFVDSTEKEWKASQPIKPKPMDELLSRMKNGWEVGEYEEWGKNRIVAQKGGLGKGGDAKDYSRNVTTALEKRGLIKLVAVKKFPLQAKFVLTEKGKGR